MFKFNDFNYYSGPFQVLPDRLLSNLSKLYSTHTDFVTPLPTLDKKILIILSFLGLKEERAKFWLSTTPHVWGFQLNEEFFLPNISQFSHSGRSWIKKGKLSFFREISRLSVSQKNRQFGKIHFSLEPWEWRND